MKQLDIYGNAIDQIDVESTNFLKSEMINISKKKESAERRLKELNSKIKQIEKLIVSINAKYKGEPNV